MENFADLLLRQIRIYTQILNSLKFHANTSFCKKYRSELPVLFRFGTKWTIQKKEGRIVGKYADVR